MAERSIYEEIAGRTNGDIYIGVVGPVRSGKSTLIKQFMEHLILPNIEGEYVRERAKDEMPQSGSGRTVMTTEPKFIPEKAAEVMLDGTASVRVKLIDCVGYVIPGIMGHTENGEPRMVMTPWSEDPLPFEQAAETGTEKVIREHATIGVAVTTDGSIGELPRENYEEAEARVVRELKEQGKPFVVVLNCTRPSSAQTKELKERMEASYGVPVLPINCLEMGENDIREILKNVLYEFPVTEIRMRLPSWIGVLEEQGTIRGRLYETLGAKVRSLHKVGEVLSCFSDLTVEDGEVSARVEQMRLGEGSATVEVRVPEGVFYRILGERTGFDVHDERDLMSILSELSSVKKKYDKVASAMDDVMKTGYGIVMPSVEDMTLEEPEIVKQPGGYGVKLKASAPSIHMMKADIRTEVSPIVGTESQSEELVRFLLREFEENPASIWESNMFGKTLHELVSEGLTGKLAHMPTDARQKITDTIGRIVNEGSGGLICILL